MVRPLGRVMVKRPEQAFRSEAAIAAEWEALRFTAPPNLTRATEEHARLVSILERAGAEVLMLPEDSRTTLDSIYTHDPMIVTREGAIVLELGKKARRGEARAMADALHAFDIPIFARLEAPEAAEGGDLVWLDERTLLAGRGFRTNAAGLERLRAVLAPLGVTVFEAQLPYWTGPEDVVHLMSFLSLVDDDLAVVHRRLLPAPLFELLESRGIAFVDVPEEELATQGPNVLALAPRHVLMLEGNPRTREGLERAGCRVEVLDLPEIAMKGSGGPTCLTRPVHRA